MEERLKVVVLAVIEQQEKMHQQELAAASEL
jgi:hypothetical protein